MPDQEDIHSNTLIRRRQLFGVSLTSLAAVGMAEALRPREEILFFAGMDMDRDIPQRFGSWFIDPHIMPIMPDAATLAAVNQIYSATLARTYLDGHGHSVMLSLAYGRRQDDNMRLHRPEGCYQGQGFAVKPLPPQDVVWRGNNYPCVRMFAAMPGRPEYVTYWMVVAGRRVLNATEAKLAQLSQTLRGKMPDGLLFRMSSIGADEWKEFSIHQKFLSNLLESVPKEFAHQLLGSRG